MPQNAPVTRLAEIIRKVQHATLDLPVRDLHGMFQADPHLVSVSVEERGLFRGSVTRKELLNLLSRPFVMELYCRKPVSALLLDLQGTKVVLSPSLEINEAAVVLLSQDPTLQNEAVMAVEYGRCLGVVVVSDLMMAVAEQQRELLQALDLLSSRLRDEVALGVKIQQDLLPPPSFRFGPIAIGAGVATCSEIGGDFFDYFGIGEDVLGLVIADVSGHGVQAGMVTTAAKASLHTLISLGITTPAGLLSGMNQAILATVRQSLLMTCLIVTIDLSARSLTIANAGHNFPLVMRKAGMATEMLDEAAGFPLGFDREAAFPEASTTFNPGDTLFLYTDGIVESTSSGGEELGYERLQQLLLQTRELPVNLVHDTLLKNVVAFTGSTRLGDDLTTVIARFDEQHINRGEPRAFEA